MAKTLSWRHNRTFGRATVALLAALGVIGGSAGAVPMPTPKPRVEGGVERPIGLKPYFASPPPDDPDPITEQRARDYRSEIDRELRRLERSGEPTDRRAFDRMQELRRERSRMDRIIQD